MPQPGRREAAVLAFTAHNVVVADVDPSWVRQQLPPVNLTPMAQVAPGNAASVRAFLAAGYAPVGAEAVLVR